MKILYITTFYDKYGGAEALVKETSNYFLKNNSVDVISIMPSLKVFSPNKSYDIDVDHTISYILEKIESNNYDFVHVFLGHSLLLKIAIELKSHRVKVLFHIIDAWFTFPYFKERIEQLIDKDFFAIRKYFPKSEAFKSFVKLSKVESDMEILCKKVSLLEFADKIIVCSEDVRDYLIKYHNAPIKDINVVPLYNRLNKPKYEELISSNITNIAYIGRVSDSWKGFSILLKSINQKGYKLYVFDNTKNLNKYISAFKKIKDTGNSDLILVNNVIDDDKIEAMKNISIVVIPSIAEGFSFVMIESMSLGKIVIAGCKFGGPKDVIENGVNGFYFKPGNYKSLSKVLDKIKKLEFTELKKVSKNAFDTAKKYTKDRYLKSLDRTYEEFKNI